MAQFLKEYPILNKELQDELRDDVLKDPNVMNDSQLYSVSVGEKYIDKEKRSSKYKLFTNQTLFDISHKLIDVINSKDTEYTFKLVQNDITYIKYGVGDFFKPHEDYLSLTSNFIEEFTLIICINADCDGGATIFHINEYFKHASSFSKTPYSAVLFRKDIKHEGEMLTRGSKEILTFNLWGIPREANTDVLVVAVADSDKKFIISQKRIFALDDTFFSKMITFKKQQASGVVITSEIIKYNAPESYEDFNVIYRIINGNHITTDEFIRCKAAIDFYQIKIKYIFMSIINAPELDAESSKKGKEEDAGDDAGACEFVFTDEVQIMRSEDDTNNILQVVKETGMPWIPFKIVLIEGSYIYGGGMSGVSTQHLNMVPVWFSCGELNNIYKWTPIITTDIDISTKKFFECSKWKSHIQNPEVLNSHVKILDIYHYDDRPETIDSSDGSEFTNIIMNKNWCYEFSGFNFYVCHPDLTKMKIIETIEMRELPNDINGMLYAPNIITSKTTKHWSLDSNGKMFVNTEQAKMVHERIKDPSFMECVLKQLKTQDFPQERADFEEDFCNENVYGNCTLLYLTGFIKFD